MTDPFRFPRALGARLAVAALLAATVLGAAAQATGRLRPGDYIVAVVNTELVTAVEVEQRVRRIRAEAERAKAPLPDDAALRQQVLDALIDERVLSTYARDSGARVDEVELERALGNVAAQNQLSPAQLRQRIEADGMDYARFRSTLRDQMLVERVREREVNARIRISDADVDRAVAGFGSEAAASVELNLAQILVSVPDNASPAVEAERRARIEQALARVRGGADFTAVAREVSEDNNRANGGVIGRRPASRLPDLFVDAVSKLSVGQVSEPIRSGAGFHLLKVIERGEVDALKVTQTRARHILMRVSDRSSVPAVTDRLAQVRRQIDSGQRRFEDLARELSEDGSAPQGGDLGWAAPGTYVPEFEDAMNRLPVGGVSAPVVSRFGVHLIQVVERRDVEQDPKQVREQARGMLRAQKFDQAQQEWTRELRLRAYIELREPPL